MENLFADYKTAKLLKEIGFDEECIDTFSASSKKSMFEFTKSFGIYKNSKSTYSPSDKDLPQYISRPTYQQVKEWLYKKHKIFISVNKVAVKKYHAFFETKDENKIPVWNEKKDKFLTRKMYYDSPLVVEIECIEAAVIYLYNLKNKK